MYKANGGRVTVLFLVNETSELWSSALVDRQVRVGEKLFFNKDRYLTVIGQKEKVFYFNLDFDRALFLKILNRFGRMPIPPYIKNTPLKEPQLRKSYQTIFASQIGPACRQAGSSAAPTAALHFTKRVFNKLERKGVKRAYITLNIGMGTFAPINENNIKTKRLHEEYYQVDETAVKKIAKANNEGNKIVAVGTTVVRTLESAAKPGMDKTDIFIMPPYRFRVVDVMITNFHLPRSSLMMLVEAFLQSKRSKKSLVDLYKIAINEKLRFYSFGDAMLIL
jgi:S-adenosylmethionine:tRNA ribosyltransferase-isomerase